MNLTYEKKEAMTFIGYHTEIKPEEGYVKCPEFWDKAYNERYARLWQTMKPETPIEEALLANGVGMFAICSCNGNGFTYWIAGIYHICTNLISSYTFANEYRSYVFQHKNS